MTSSNEKNGGNLKEEARRKANLRVLQRSDGSIRDIIESATHVVLYEFDQEMQQWEKKQVEGSLFLVRREEIPIYKLIILNRTSTENFELVLTNEFQLQNSDPYLMIRQKLLIPSEGDADDTPNKKTTVIRGIYFHSGPERDSMAALLTKSVQALKQKTPTPPPPSSTTTTRPKPTPPNQQQNQQQQQQQQQQRQSSVSRMPPHTMHDHVHPNEASAALLSTLGIHSSTSAPVHPSTVSEPILSGAKNHHNQHPQQHSISSSNSTSTATSTKTATKTTAPASAPSTSSCPHPTVDATTTTPEQQQQQQQQQQPTPQPSLPMNQQPVVLDKKSLQLALLSLIQDERFLDLIHAQYLKVAHARAKNRGGIGSGGSHGNGNGHATGNQNGSTTTMR